MKKHRYPAEQFLARISIDTPFPVACPAAGGSLSLERAAAIVARHGRLHVGETGAGLSAARSDVEFYPEPDPDADEYVEEWVPLLGPLSAFADAHNAHEILFVDDAGGFYAYTVPDGKLYPLGRDFVEAMACMLLGKRLGPAIAANGGERGWRAACLFD